MNDVMKFYNLIEFYLRKELIRTFYTDFGIEEKEYYKMYVYSLPFMKDDIKDLIWEYLNGFEESEERLVMKYQEEKEKRNGFYNKNEVR